MELTFPFKNICVNNLIAFVDAYEILNYIEFKEGRDLDKNFETYVGIYESSLPNFENELLQVLNTTDQTTINAYFNMLAGEVNYINDTVNFENITATIQKFNFESLSQYERDIEDETANILKAKIGNGIIWKNMKALIIFLSIY